MNRILINSSTKKQYVLQAKLGSGASGAVFLAKNSETQETYAIKEIDSYLNDEIKITKAFIQITQNMEHVVKFLDVFSVESDKYHTYILMEYCNQPSLYDQMLKKKRENKPFTHEEIIDIMLQVCEGLRELHSQRILHRDIKPENIVAHGDDGPRSKLTYKICDIGISKQAVRAETKQIGTPYYMSPELIPELIQGKQGSSGYSFEIDIWSLGNVFYELLFGETFYKGSTAEEIYDKIRNVNHTLENQSKGFKNLDQDFQYLLNAMINRDPKERLELKYVVERLKKMQKKNFNSQQSKPEIIPISQQGDNVTYLPSKNPKIKKITNQPKEDIISHDDDPQIIVVEKNLQLKGDSEQQKLNSQAVLQSQPKPNTKIKVSQKHQIKNMNVQGNSVTSNTVQNQKQDPEDSGIVNPDQVFQPKSPSNLTFQSEDQRVDQTSYLLKDKDMPNYFDSNQQIDNHSQTKQPNLEESNDQPHEHKQTSYQEEEKTQKQTFKELNEQPHEQKETSYQEEENTQKQEGFQNKQSKQKCQFQSKQNNNTDQSLISDAINTSTVKDSQNQNSNAFYQEHQDQNKQFGQVNVPDQYSQQTRNYSTKTLNQLVSKEPFVKNICLKTQTIQGSKSDDEISFDSLKKEMQMVFSNESLEKFFTSFQRKDFIKKRDAKDYIFHHSQIIIQEIKK